MLKYNNKPKGLNWNISNIAISTAFFYFFRWRPHQVIADLVRIHTLSVVTASIKSIKHTKQLEMLRLDFKLLHLLTSFMYASWLTRKKRQISPVFSPLIKTKNPFRCLLEAPIRKEKMKSYYILDSQCSNWNFCFPNII